MTTVTFFQTYVEIEFHPYYFYSIRFTRMNLSTRQPYVDNLPTVIARLNHRNRAEFDHKSSGSKADLIPLDQPDSTPLFSTFSQSRRKTKQIIAHSNKLNWISSRKMNWQRKYLQRNEACLWCQAKLEVWSPAGYVGKHASMPCVQK